MQASLQFSNLPGPTSTVVIGGYPLKGIYPIYPPPGRLRAAISVLTYADQVHITVVTHRSLLNAGPKLMKGMTEQVKVKTIFRFMNVLMDIICNFYFILRWSSFPASCHNVGFPEKVVVRHGTLTTVTQRWQNPQPDR